jgi:gamma-glutamyl hydrolase
MKNGQSLATLTITITLLITIGAVNTIPILKTKLMDRVDEPVIGIVTLPLSPYFKRRFGYQYAGIIPTSYKKWIEQTGARAVAIPHFKSLREISQILNQVNGILFPGGKSELKR